MKFYTHDEILNQYIGVKGTREREKFDSEISAWIKQHQTKAVKDLKSPHKTCYETNKSIIKEHRAMNEHLKTNLINWAKSTLEELPEELTTSVNAYFEKCGANSANTKEDKIERRKIVAKGIVIQCLYALDEHSTQKLEASLLLLSSTLNIRKGWGDAFEKYAQNEQELLIPDYLLKEAEANLHCSINPNDKKVKKEDYGDKYNK